MRLSIQFALALSALSFMVALPASPAFATADGPDFYRVVKVNGSATLHMRARPGKFSRSVYNLPFNARRLNNRIETRGSWALVEYDGRTGWVHTDYLAEDDGNRPTVYKVTGLESWDGLNIRKNPKAGSRIIGEVPGSADNIEDYGDCKGLWCPIRYDNVEGWVHKRFLAVVPSKLNPSPGDRYYSQYERRRDFRDRYDNEYMGLRERRPTWFDRFWMRNKHMFQKRDLR